MTHGENKAQAGQEEHADIRTDLSRASQRTPEGLALKEESLLAQSVPSC